MMQIIKPLHWLCHIFDDDDDDDDVQDNDDDDDNNNQKKPLHWLYHIFVRLSPHTVAPSPGVDLIIDNWYLIID